MTSTADAEVILEIDFSNPSAVIFTATTANSAITEEGVPDFTSGMTLLDFFSSGTTGPTGQALLSTGLKPTTSITSQYSELWGGTKRDVFGNGDLTDRDLNFSQDQNTFVQEFFFNQRAFVGSATADLSAFADQFPSLGTSGDIMLGDNRGFNSNLILGQWSVTAVPEPSSLLVFTICSAGIVYRRRRHS